MYSQPRRVASLLRAAGVRQASSFAYVRPGRVMEHRHTPAWSVWDEPGAWNSASIPRVDPTLASAVDGRVDAWWADSTSAVEAELASLQATSPDLYFVAALRSLMTDNAAGSSLPDAAWHALLAPVSEAERTAVATADGRRALILSLHEQAGQLRARMLAREQEAMDNGEVDLALPITQAQRETLQATRNAGILHDALKLARALSILNNAADAALPTEMRLALSKAQSEASIATVPKSALEREAYARGESLANLPISSSELENEDHFETYEEYKHGVLAQRDRLDVVSRRRLPVPMHKGAPNEQLADMARVVDENPSMSAADKQYIMEHYADALAGKKEAFDTSAERAAYVDPQPQWGVYDPDRVREEDDALDAVRAAGKYSRAKGYVVAEEAIAPASVGEVDVDPSRTPLTTSEEVSAIMREYDAATARQVRSVQESITAVLEQSMGIKMPGSASASSAATAAAGENAAAILAAKQKLASGKAPGAALPGVSAPDGMSQDEASKVVSAFFSSYLAGKRLAPPSPPLRGPRKDAPPAATPNANAKGGKGKKK